MTQFVDLESVIKSGNRSKMFECFGTHFSAKIDDVDLVSKANIMIPKLEVAIQNWRTVIEAVQPKAAEQRDKRLKDKVAELRKMFTPEEIKGILGE